MKQLHLRDLLPLSLVLLPLAGCSGSSSPPSDALPPPAADKALDLVLFSSHDAVTGTRELWASLLLESGQAGLARLNHTLTAGGRVDHYERADLEGRVVYRTVEAAQDAEVGRLWTISVGEVMNAIEADDASLPVVLQEIGGPLPAGHSILDFALSPDGNHVVFRESGGGDVALYRVDLSGDEPGEPVDLRFGEDSNSRAAAGTWTLSPDGTRIAWLAHSDTHDLLLRTLTPEDGGPQLVNGSSEADRPVSDFKFGPGSKTLAYRQKEQGSHHLWHASVPLGGRPSAAAVEPGLGARYKVLQYDFNSTGSHLLYRVAVTAVAEGGSDSETHESLALVDVSGASPAPTVDLSGPLPVGGQVRWSEWSDDDSYLLYLANQSDVGKLELSWIGSPLASPTAPVTVNDPLPEGGQLGLRVQPDLAQQYVLYRADQYVAGQVVLMQAVVGDMLPGMPWQLTPEPAPGGGASSQVSVAPDGLSAVYAVDLEVAGRKELYRIAIGPDPAPEVPFLVGPGSVPHEKLSPPIAEGGKVFGDLVFSSTGSLLLFRADTDGDGNGELYCVTFDTEGVASEPMLVSAGLPEGLGAWDDYTLGT